MRLLEVQKSGFGKGTEFFASKLPDVLSAQQELDAFRDFEQKEIAYWASLLSCSPAFKTIEKIILTKVPAKEITEISRMRKLLPSMDKAKWRTLATSLASKLREIDKDRRLVAAVDQAVQQFVRNKDYLSRVKEAKLSQQKAKNRLVTANIRLVILVATKYPQGTLLHEDLIQEGTLGLIKAVERFDPNLGYRFSTYAIWWIRKTLALALEAESLVRIPAEMAHKCLKVSKAEQKVVTLTGQAGVEEVANEAKLTLEQLNALRLITTYKQYLPIDAMKIAGSPDESSDEEEACKVVKEMLASLPVREAQVLTMYFGLGRQPEAIPLREVGLRMNVTGERAKQLKDSAFGKLRENCKVDGRTLVLST